MTGGEEDGKKRFRKMLLLVIVTGSRSHGSSGISSLIMHIDQEKWEDSRQRGKEISSFTVLTRKRAQWNIPDSPSAKR